MGSLLSLYVTEDGFEELGCELSLDTAVNQHKTLPYMYDVNTLLAYIDVCTNDDIIDREDKQLVF